MSAEEYAGKHIIKFNAEEVSINKAIQIILDRLENMEKEIKRLKKENV